MCDHDGKATGTLKIEAGYLQRRVVCEGCHKPLRFWLVTDDDRYVPEPKDLDARAVHTGT